MTDIDIAALAREYAEENFTDDKDFIDETENTIRFLLRRFYLVEKSKAEQVNKCIKTKAVDVVMNLLFPDIAQEHI